MPLPPALAAVMVAFQPLFSNTVYTRVVLLVGALLAVRTRTVTAALRITACDTSGFSAYHRVLSRARWSPRQAARVLLGLVVERIEPGKPQQNGRHERMHKTLKAETTRPPETTFAPQQRRFDDFRHCYNEQRPHEALGQTTPASHYRASLRPLPERVPEPAYAGYFEVAE